MLPRNAGFPWRISGLLDQVLVPIHRAGWPFVAAFFAVSIILGFLWQPLFWLGLLATAWCIFFFRDPPRVVPVRPGLLVSPADGRIQWVGPAKPPPELGLGDAPLTRISIFLNIFDVHINRVPIDGTVAALHYHAGKFLNAALDKASEENERQAARIETADGRAIGLVQIAGLVARRIVCELEVGQPVRAGERFGLIRFGSRTDVFLPLGVAPLVAVGQRAIGGETVLADLVSGEPQRRAEVR
jgi:phosphatidylserine decarboxylase